MILTRQVERKIILQNTHTVFRVFFLRILQVRVYSKKPDSLSLHDTNFPSVLHCTYYTGKQ